MFLDIAHAKQVLGVDRVLLWSYVSKILLDIKKLLDIKEFYFETGVGKAKRYISMHEVVEALSRNTSMIPEYKHDSRCTEVATSQGELLDGLESLGNSIAHLRKKNNKGYFCGIGFTDVNSSLDNVRY